MFLNHRDDVARVHLKPETKRNASDASQELALKPEKKDDEDVAVASERKARAEAERLRRRVFAQLARDPPAGAKFAEALTLALRRERHWTRWKRSENCRAFERARLGDRRRTARRKSCNRFAFAELGEPRSFASATPSWTGCGTCETTRIRGKRRTRMVSRREARGNTLDAFLRRVREDADPEARIEEPYKRRNDAAFRWR